MWPLKLSEAGVADANAMDIQARLQGVAGFS